MRLFALFFFVPLLVPFVPASLAAEEPGAAADSRAAELSGLPRVPVRTAIVKAGAADSAAVSEWVRVVMETKVKRAEAELAAIKKQVRDEEQVRLVGEADRRRREERYAQTWGALGASAAASERRGAVRLRLDFQVPEIAAYRLAADASRARSALAHDVAQALGQLDRDGDGRLSGDEYRDAASVVLTTGVLFQPLDASGDALLSPEEYTAFRGLPENAAAALRAGRAATVAGAADRTLRVGAFDKNADGDLDVDERKALTMGYVEASVRDAQDAAFYTLVAGSLVAARETVAAKFANVEVSP
jgi:hypothetical protein